MLTRGRTQSGYLPRSDRFPPASDPQRPEVGEIGSVTYFAFGVKPEKVSPSRFRQRGPSLKMLIGEPARDGVGQALLVADEGMSVEARRPRVRDQHIFDAGDERILRMRGAQQ